MLEWVYGVCRARAARYPNSIELNEDEDDEQTDGGHGQTIGVLV
jgi:hypothetical protein